MRWTVCVGDGSEQVVGSWYGEKSRVLLRQEKKG